ncbi:MAG: helix-turn-helix domain-containing protein [Acetobacteraceae bacterium]
MTVRHRTEFPENHYYVPDPAWARSAFAVVRAGKVIAAPDYRIERSAYPGQDVLFCCSGHGFAQSEGATAAVGPDQLVWIANEAPHAHWPDESDPWTLLWFRLTGPDCAVVRRKIFGAGSTRIDVPRALPIEAWFGRLFGILGSRKVETDLALNHLVAEFLYLLASRAPKLGAAPLPKSLQAALAEMRGAPERPWLAADIAGATRLSAAQTRRLFHRYLGVSPRQWLIRERIGRSQRLLLETDASVSEVAELCGFCDVFHFSREFSRRVGVSPRRWRRA